MALLGRFLVVGATGNVGRQVVTGAVETITGRAPRSFHHWALDHAEAFR